MKKGFGLPQAIMIMLFIATIAMMGVKYSQVAVNHYSDTYVKEQAQLFLQSAKEHALYRISGYDRVAKNKCLETIYYTSPSNSNTQLTLKATTTVKKYFLLEGSDDATICGTLTKKIKTPESHGMVQLLIEVKAYSDSKAVLTLYDRSIQRP